MEKLFRFIMFIAILLIISALAFFFWATSPNYKSQTYNQLLSYNIPIIPSGDSTLTVMSYNIGYLSGMTNNLAVRPSQEFYHTHEKAILQKIKTVRPDLIGFQEIDYNSKRSYYQDQHALIAETLYCKSC